MKIKFLGAAGCVTGSSYVLTSDGGKSILVDFGVFQGSEELEKKNFEPVGYDLSLLTAVVLTHAHLDHCGRLPLLFTHGFKGNIWMTPPTRDLAEITLYDSAKIAKEQESKALFDHNLAVQTILKFETIDYRTPKRIGDFTVTFRDAGHILGAASLEIIDNTANGKIKKIVFSGDLGNTPEDLEKETEFIDNSDAVVVESTYGDRLHPKSEPEDAILAEIKEIEKTNGALLIPTFSIDRTQEILHIINHFKNDGLVKA
ncbi:MAG: MBL fold metallo-hydrolase, partial [Bacteroidales bacterium]|nr:MBL fold metallo-hydrolase [Bacteroidales bacterium]